MSRFMKLQTVRNKLCGIDGSQMLVKPPQKSRTAKSSRASTSTIAKPSPKRKAPIPADVPMEKQTATVLKILSLEISPSIIVGKQFDTTLLTMRYGRTGANLLHAACWWRVKELVSYLIDDIGINPNDSDIFDQRALDYVFASSIEGDYKDVVSILVSKGAKIGPTSLSICTDRALDEGDVNALTCFFTIMKVSPNRRGFNGISPIDRLPKLWKSKKTKPSAKCVLENCSEFSETLWTIFLDAIGNNDPQFVACFLKNQKLLEEMTTTRKKELKRTMKYYKKHLDVERVSKLFEKSKVL